MFTKDNVLQQTGCTDAQFRRWIEAGLLPHARTAGRGNKGGVGRVYRTSTVERVRIIQEMLTSGHTLEDAAFELLLQGYLIRADIMRKALSVYLEQAKRVTARRQHKHNNELTDVQRRDSIHRSVGSRLPALKRQDYQHERALIEFSMRYMNGVPRTREIELYGLPPITYDFQLQTIQDLEDYDLIQALKQAHSLQLQKRADFTRLLVTLSENSLTQEDIIRLWLPGHLCPFTHSPFQAAFPLALWFSISPPTSEQIDKMNYFLDELAHTEQLTTKI
jgi:DNA-binding transcriptional MerR regulator